MAKVFRLFDDTPMTHWQSRSTDYSSVIIEKIISPDGDQSSILPTSIPSPFARLDLFNTAFRYFNDANNKLDGYTNNHKLVSDCLDLLELLYNKDSINGELTIKVWDKQRDLAKLTDSSYSRHQLLGRTLDLFLKQDDEAFNFDQLHRIYIFYFNHKIIGATSPKTMVFTSANDLGFAQVTLHDRKLFTEPASLKNRDEDFIFYLMAFFKENTLLSRYMPAFYDYVKRNVKEKTEQDKTFMNAINALDVQFLENKTTIDGNDYVVEVFNVPFRTKSVKNIQERIGRESQFLIHASKTVEGLPPMVLATNGNLGMLDYLYQGVKWDVNTKVQHPADQILEVRILPGKDVKYPYLTVDDFLEQEVYETPYEINKDAFFDGHFTNESDQKGVGYLLPLKKAFFTYFSEEDLNKRSYSGKKMIEIIKKKSSVNVKLRIPIDGGRHVVELEKKYETNDINPQKGKIIPCAKYFQLFPIQRASVNPNYYVQVIDEGLNDYSHTFQLAFDDHAAAARTMKAKRDSRNGSFYNTYYFRCRADFNAIHFKEEESQCSNYLIPLWRNERHIGGAFTFALDFGTSNTHVEYSVNKSIPSPLDLPFDKNGFATSFNKLNTNISSLHEIQNHKDLEFIAENISSESNYNFPIRTVLFDYNNFNPANFQPILDYNIGFTYEKTGLPTFNNVRPRTNLKWVNGIENIEGEAWMRCFLEQLVVMCKTKVLVERGDLSKTRFTWTYPLSYGQYKINLIAGLIEELVTIHFGPGIETIKLSESIAPFYSIASTGKILGTSNTILSLDIGGGTIDSVVYQNRKVINISSVLFGANYLYSAGYTTDLRSNGFYKLGTKFFSGLSSVKGYHNLQEIETTIEQGGKIEDIIAYYFSLDKKRELQDVNNKSFNAFLAMHANERAVFLFYLAAIIYNSVKAMKIAGIPAPSYMSFSGTGSKFLSIIDKSGNKESIVNYAAAIINAVYGLKDSSDKIRVKVLVPDNPKELTSKGAINVLEEGEEVLTELSMNSLDEKFRSYIGDKEGTIISNDNPLSYEELKSQFNESAYEAYTEFVSLFLQLPGINYKNDFGIDYDLKRKFEDTLMDKKIAIEFLEAGMAQRTKQISATDMVSDNLCFYIVRGMLGEMLNKLHEDENW
ncbi:MAG: hypothetical protein K0R59_3214 [Sphingobacterium sp.]|jgi:hypothetical protein|nr:hypothetical protein [Sphingobacterium sp.]